MSAATDAGFKIVSRVRVKQKENSVAERTFVKLVELLKESGIDKDNEALGEFLDGALVKKSMKELTEKRYIYELATACRRFSLRSITSSTRKNDIKHNAMKAFKRCSNRFEFRDDETGEIVVFEAGDEIPFDEVGDLRAQRYAKNA